MIKEIREKAYAKLNISLDVTDKREDGYHNMLMVMQSVSLSDSVYIQVNDTGIFTAATNFKYIPNGEKNLAVKAAMRFFAELGDEKSGARISIKKNIPVGSGMGGGSSDAAAVLRALNRLNGKIFSPEKLAELGADVGSDVPFCVMGGTALVKGRGEILKPLKPLPKCWFVICKPIFSISTPELFRKLDDVSSRIHPDTAGILEGIECGDIYAISRRMYNVFERIDDRRMKSIASIKAKLLDLGAIGSVMTGSGSAVFGVFENENLARRAEEVFKRDNLFCCVAVPV